MSEKRDISMNEFTVGVDHIEKYNPGDEVTRNNFSHMLITSFYVSKGSIFRQEMFLKWIQAKNGFDYDRTIRNFFSAGGWDSLSREEQKIFTDTFVSIGRHHKEGVVRNFLIKPNSELRQNTPTYFYQMHPEEVGGAVQDMADFNREYGNLVSMDYKDLIRNLNSFGR